MIPPIGTQIFYGKFLSFFSNPQQNLIPSWSCFSQLYFCCCCCCCRFPVNVLSSNKHKPFELISREKRISTWHKVREEWLRLSVWIQPTHTDSQNKPNVCHRLLLGVGSGVLVPWFCSDLCFFLACMYSSRCSDCCVTTQHHFLPPPVCMIIEEIIDGALDMWHTSHGESVSDSDLRIERCKANFGDFMPSL